MKALVTGGAGFIGSNLVKYLCDNGYQVTALDDFSSSGRIKIDPRAKLIRGTIDNSKLLEKLLKGKDVVFHLAATGIIKISLKNPLLYFENNFLNGVKILDAMRKTGVEKIVYSSSAGVYGEPKWVPIKEDDPKEPVNPYGASKFAFEHALSSYYHVFGIESVSLRYFNVYGPGDGQRPVTRAVPSWIQSMLQGGPVPMYWRGQQRKDYVFVGDVVRANLLAAEKGKGCAVYNVASGQGLPMLEIFRILEKIMGRKFEIQHMGDRTGDPSILVADVSKIKKELGWKPEVDLETGLRLAVEYYRRAI